MIDGRSMPGDLEIVFILAASPSTNFTRELDFVSVLPK